MDLRRSFLDDWKADLDASLFRDWHGCRGQRQDPRHV